MRVPLSWLLDYVAFEGTPAELAERLTFSGTEVEAIEAADAGIPNVVAAEILSVSQHPAEPGLKVCRVNAGSAAGELTIVCGAPDTAKGLRVPLALPGARLPSGQVIAQTAIKGVVSQGMLCAEDELGFSNDHSTLMQLPADMAPGTAIGEVLGGSDTVFVLEITPNRPDCLSIMGIAREIAALTGARLKMPPVLPCDEGSSKIEWQGAVEVEDEEGCPRYTLRALTGATVRQSPLWLRRRLTLAGVRPINNLVDVTNYVMLECGQPLHAFDARRIEGRMICVRRAMPGERLHTLDGEEKELSEEILVIADAKKPLALAGIMGGEASGIAPDTTELWLESACFQTARVRMGTRTLGMGTESSRRFERGVDIMTVDWAARRAVFLMAELSGATPAAGCIDAFPLAPADRLITCRFESVKDLLGLAVTPAEICDIFERLLLKVTDRDKSRCVVLAPSFRGDLVNEADLIEEVARVHGLDKIPTHAPAGRVVPDADDKPWRARERCAAVMAGLGMAEIYNYSMLSAAQLDAFGAGLPAQRVQLPNPISQDQAWLRPSLLPQMAATLGYNRSRQQQEAALFEVGRIFFRNADSGALHEQERMALGLMGPVGRHDLDKRRAFDAQEIFLWLKGIMEEAARALRTSVSLHGEEQYAAAAASLVGLPWNAFEPGYRALVKAGDVFCGAAGILRRDIAAEWRFASEPVALAELNLAPLLENAFTTPLMIPLPAHPKVVRDVAMTLPLDTPHEKVLEVIRKNAPDTLTDARLFDMYKDVKTIGVGRKSVAYSLTYRSQARTLTDEEVNEMHLSVVNALKSELKAEIRES